MDVTERRVQKAATRRLAEVVVGGAARREIALFEGAGQCENASELGTIHRRAGRSEYPTENRADGDRGITGSGCCGRLDRLDLHFVLAAQNRAPILVFGNGHPAFHAHADTGFGWLGTAQQSFEQ